MERQLSASRAPNVVASSEATPSKRKAHDSEESIVAISPPRIVNRAPKKVKRMPTAEPVKSAAKKQIQKQTKLKFDTLASPHQTVNRKPWHEELRRELSDGLGKQELKATARKQTTLMSFYGDMFRSASARPASATPAPMQDEKAEHETPVQDEQELLPKGESPTNVSNVAKPHADARAEAILARERGEDDVDANVGNAAESTRKNRNNPRRAANEVFEMLDCEIVGDTDRANMDASDYLGWAERNKGEIDAEGGLEKRETRSKHSVTPKSKLRIGAGIMAESPKGQARPTFDLRAFRRDDDLDEVDYSIEQDKNRDVRMNEAESPTAKIRRARPSLADRDVHRLPRDVDQTLVAQQQREASDASGRGEIRRARPSRADDDVHRRFRGGEAAVGEQLPRSASSTEREDAPLFALQGMARTSTVVEQKNKNAIARAKPASVLSDDDTEDEDEEEAADLDQREQNLLARAFKDELPQGESPLNQTEWTAFRRQHEAAVSAYVRSCRPLLDDFKAAFAQLPPVPTVPSRFTRDSSPFAALKGGPPAADCSESDHLALSIVHCIQSAVPCVADADAIRDFFVTMSTSTSQPGDISEPLQNATKALFNPIIDEIKRIAPGLVLQHPSGLLNAATSFQLHYPPPPAVAETLHSPCATMKIVRAQGVNHSSFVGDVVFAHRAVPPESLQPRPGHKAIFDGKASFVKRAAPAISDDSQAVATLKADSLMFALHEEVVRLRAQAKTFNVVASGVAWQNTQEALARLGEARLGEGWVVREVQNVFQFKIDYYVPVRALIVFKVQAKRTVCQSVFLKIDHPSAQFYRRAPEKAVLADAANALLALARGGVVLHPSAHRVYRDLFGMKVAKAAKKENKFASLRKAELARKEAFGVEELPQDILDLAPGLDFSDVVKKGQYAGYKTRTALGVIAKRLWQEYESTASRIFGFATHSERVKKQWQGKSDEERKAQKQACREGAINYFSSLSKEQMQARTDKIIAAQNKWNNEVIEGKGTRRNVLGIGVAEKQGLISARRIPNGPDVRDEIKYTTVRGLVPRINQFLEAGVSKILNKKYNSVPQKIWDLGLRGHEVHGWPEGYAYGASVSGGHLKNGKRRANALIELGQIWQLVVDGEIYFRNKKSGAKVFGYEDLPDGWEAGIVKV